MSKGKVDDKIIFCARNVKFDLKNINLLKFVREGEKVVLFLKGKQTLGVVDGENFALVRAVELKK